jgi:O-antigen/teichoic acid export membrane protein
MALMLVRLLAMARLLDINGFGQYSAGLLVSSTFGMLACLGLHSMLLRELPVMMVRKRVRAGTVLLAQCIVVALACAAACALLVLAGVSMAGLSVTLLLISLLHGLSQQVFVITSVESRSRGAPLEFSRQNLARASAILVLGAGAAHATGSPAWALLTEALVTLALTQAALVSIFRRAGSSALLAYRLALRRLPKVRWRSAAALFAVGMLAFMLLNADRWVAAQGLSSERFAQYAFAWLLLTAAQSVQLVVSSSVFPLLARRYGTLGVGAAYRLCASVSWALLLGGALLGLPAWALLDMGINRWFAEYRAAIELLPLFIAVAVLRVSDYWSSFLMIVGFENRLLALNVLGAAGAALAWLLWVRPWEQPVGLWHIGLLAALLTGVNYLVTCIAALQVARR